MKKIREYIFHSRDLLPMSLSSASMEDRISFVERGGHYYRVGDKVVHRDNLEMQMSVKEVIMRKVSVKTGAVGEDDKPVYIKRNRIEGILCYWFE
jgi:hypothetical protein